MAFTARARLLCGLGEVSSGLRARLCRRAVEAMIAGQPAPADDQRLGEWDKPPAAAYNPNLFCD